MFANIRTFDTKSTKSGADCDAAPTRNKVRGTLSATTCSQGLHRGEHDRLPCGSRPLTPAAYCYKGAPLPKQPLEISDILFSVTMNLLHLFISFAQPVAETDKCGHKHNSHRNHNLKVKAGCNFHQLFNNKYYGYNTLFNKIIHFI